MKKKKIKDVPQKPTYGSSIKSYFKYVYLIVFFVLLSGFFHPLITETSSESTVLGTFVLLVGLAGGVLLYRATTAESYKMICMGIGFGLMATSLYYIFSLAGKI